MPEKHSHTTKSGFLHQIKSDIQSHFQLGGAQGKLRQRDFNFLSDEIESKTGVLISLSTLKRIWREQRSDYLPHPATLDALAALIDQGNWQRYKQQQIRASTIGTPSRFKRQFLPWALGVIGLFLALAIYLSLGPKPPPGVKIKGEISFSADKSVGSGVPNTVIFSYDLSQVEADSFFIQQSWNPRFKLPIDPQKEHLTTLYYRPGYHRAKLIANDSVIATQDFHLQTQGWLSFITAYSLEDRIIPLALPSDGRLAAELSDSLTRTWPSSLAKEVLAYHLRWVTDFALASPKSYHLHFQTKTLPGKHPLCDQLTLLLHGEPKVALISIAEKGCIGSLDLILPGKVLRGRDHDFSSFGVEKLTQWHTWDLTVKDDRLSIAINNELAWEGQLPQSLGELKGIGFRSGGPFEVRDVSIASME